MHTHFQYLILFALYCNGVKVIDKACVGKVGQLFGKMPSSIVY